MLSETYIVHVQVEQTRPHCGGTAVPNTEMDILDSINTYCMDQAIRHSLSEWAWMALKLMKDLVWKYQTKFYCQSAFNSIDSFQWWWLVFSGGD